MSPLRFPVAVIFERTTLTNRWVSERWEPIAVIPPNARPSARTSDGPGVVHRAVAEGEGGPEDIGDPAAQPIGAAAARD